MSMRVIPPATLWAAQFNSSTAYETPPAAYSPGTTYAIGDAVSVAGAAGLRSVYKSLQAGNVGHPPDSSPTYWQFINDTYQVYAGGSTYALGDRVISASTHMEYQSLIAGNTGNALTDQTKWFELGATSPYRVFDLVRNSATRTAVPLEFTFTPGTRVDSIAFTGLVGSEISLEIRVGGVLKYSRTENIRSRDTVGWFNWYFSPFSNVSNIGFYDLPPYSNGVFTVKLSSSSRPVSMERCMVGMQMVFGEVYSELDSDLVNYPTVSRDADGIGTWSATPNTQRNTQTILFKKSETNMIKNIRKNLNGKIAFWTALDDKEDGFYEICSLVGGYRNFRINLTYPEHGLVTLEIEQV